MPSILLLQAIEKVIQENPRIVQDLEKGNLRALGSLIGLTRKELPSANPIETKETLESRFNVKVPEKEKTEPSGYVWKRYKNKDNGLIMLLRYSAGGIVYYSPEDFSTTYVMLASDFNNLYVLQKT